MATDMKKNARAVEHENGDHPSVGFYMLIGAILAVVTFVEVAIYYMEAFDSIEALLLIALSTVKLILVVMFFMHLKFDSKVFTAVFMAGVVLAVFMVTGMVLLYKYVPYVIV